MTPDDHIFSVSALTAAVKGTLEGAFPFVWVRGQVVNVSRPSSGHVYFSLRDEECSLAAVWFRGNQKPGERFDPLTGEVYEEGPRPSLALSLENGQEIVCAGRLAVYGARGVYQLVVELAQDVGLGRLHEEFERLRNKLSALGYFALERKRPLPAHPVRVAVVTAPQGAAIYDFLRIAEGRGFGASIRIHPAPVQGEAAPAKLIKALADIAAEGWAEVAVLIRGGGSIEDLWAFNSEALARAVFESPLPVLAGIGHEVDFSLADMTADLRAATPTHAAQLLWPAREELLQRVRALSDSLTGAGNRWRERVESRLHSLVRELSFHSPARVLSGWEERLSTGLKLLENAWQRFAERREHLLLGLEAAVARPPRRLPALEAAVASLAGRLEPAAARSLTATAARLERLQTGLSLGPQRLPALESRRARLSDALDFHGEKLLTQAERRLERAGLSLEAVNPHAPLERGYALVRKADGSFVRTTRMVAPGEPLRITVHDGDISVRVEGED